MTPIEFLLALMQLYSKFPFSETGGQRTVQRNLDVDGTANSPHLHWVGRDVIFEKKPTRSELVETARRIGLTIIPERDHHHIQPAAWIAG